MRHSNNNQAFINTALIAHSFRGYGNYQVQFLATLTILSLIALITVLFIFCGV